MNYEALTNEQLENLVLQRDGEATLELAHRCRTGSKGQELNPTRAYQLYHRCEKMNMIGAFKALGDMYANGEYVAQSIDIANEYYAKAGAPLLVNDANNVPIQPTPGIDNIIPPTPTPAPTPAPMLNPSFGVDLNAINSLIENGEVSRLKGDTISATRQANEALNMINAAKNNGVSSSEVYPLEMDAYWLLAFTSFNESNYSEMDRYLSIPGVIEKHPWSIYLSSMIHISNGLPINVLEQDMEKMLTFAESPLLKPDERGDMYGMIADFYMQGIRSYDGNPMQLARMYYEKAAALGNGYAQSQLANMA